MDNRAGRAARELVEALERRGIRDRRVLAAIASVDRALFLEEEWVARAWEDRALPIASGQTISQPFIVALMTEALQLRGDETVLEVGTGSGYQAAILAQLCRQVLTIERHASLSEQAGRVFERLGLVNVTRRVGDGTRGAADVAPFDGIVVTAGAPDVPPPLLAQLSPGGRLVIPVGDEAEQELIVVWREEERFRRKHLCDCRFVPLIGHAGWPAIEAKESSDEAD